MQKKIVAVAIAAAFAAPALALADTSIYGVFDVGYQNTDKTLTTTAGAESKQGEKGLAFSTMTSSRLGINHTEDLDGGMKASFKIETALGSNVMAGVSQTGTKANGTNGTTIDATSLGNRELNATLNVSADTAIKLGYGSSWVRDISLGYAPDPGGNLIGNILNNDAALSSNRTTAVNVTQAFTKQLTGTLAYSTNTSTSDTAPDVKKGNGYLIGVKFDQDALSVAGAYQNMKTSSNAVASVAATGIYAGNPPISATDPGVPYSAGSAATDVTTKIMILGGSYNLGVAKLIGEYATVKVDDSVTADAKGSGKKSYLSIGAQAPIGDKALAFLQLSNGKNEIATTTGTAASSRKNTGYSLGGKYMLSKATYGYVTYGSTTLKEGDGTGGAAETGIKVKQYALGLVHTF